MMAVRRRPAFIGVSPSTASMAGARPNPQRLYVPESNHMFHAPEEMPHTDGDDNHPSSPSDDVVSDDVGVLDLTADTWDRDNVVVPESPEIVAQRSQTEGDNGRAQLPSRASIEGTILVHHMLPGWLSDIELLDDNAGLGADPRLSCSAEPSDVAGAPPYQEYHPARSPGRLPKFVPRQMMLSPYADERQQKASSREPGRRRQTQQEVREIVEAVAVEQQEEASAAIQEHRASTAPWQETVVVVVVPGARPGRPRRSRTQRAPVRRRNVIICT